MRLPALVFRSRVRDHLKPSNFKRSNEIPQFKFRNRTRTIVNWKSSKHSSNWFVPLFISKVVKEKTERKKQKDRDSNSENEQEISQIHQTIGKTHLMRFSNDLATQKSEKNWESWINNYQNTKKKKWVIREIWREFVGKMRQLLKEFQTRSNESSLIKRGKVWGYLVKRGFSFEEKMIRLLLPGRRRNYDWLNWRLLDWCSEIKRELIQCQLLLISVWNEMDNFRFPLL